MTDCFARLGEARRPWIDPESLKARFRTLSIRCHPDRVEAAARAAATRDFAELNAAYECLRVPTDRLLHLLTLELGRKPDEVHPIAPATMELCFEVGRVCREVDAFLAGRSREASPLLRVALFERGIEWSDTLNAVQERVGRAHEQWLSELPAMNALWQAAPAVGTGERRTALPLARLEQIFRALSHVSQWTAQLQERQTRLALSAVGA